MPDDRLDPVRLRPPRPRALLRYAVVAALLALAAGVLFLDRPAAPTRPLSCPRAAATPSASTERPPDRLAVPADRVGVPVQLAEPGTAGVLRPGDRVDVIARNATASEAEVVLAHNALVLSVHSPDEGIVYLAMTRQQAHRVAKTAPDVAIGVTVRPG